MSKTMQCRSVGPISVPGCTEEDLASLRSAVSKDGSKIKYVILSVAPNDEPGTYRFCAQAFDKLSPAAWMRQLGIAAAETDGVRREAIKGCILPSDNIGEAIEACRVSPSSSSCGVVEEFGVTPADTKTINTAANKLAATTAAKLATSTKPAVTDASTQTDNDNALDNYSEPADLTDFDVGATTTGKGSKRKRCPTYHQYGDLRSTVSAHANRLLDQMEAHPSCSQFWTYVHPKRACQELLLAKMAQFRE